jgi:TrmH family RNA methyltransferase
VNPLRVVLVSPRNPLNIGAAARAMSNFGFSEMRLVNPYEVAFREARSAVKARGILARAREYPALADAVADCGLVVGTTSIGPRALEHPLRRLEYGARLIRKKLAAAPVALLFGSEKFGLSNEDMSHCHWLMRIPAREEHGSMNLGQAVAVCLYEIIRSPAAARAKPEPRRPATAQDLERLTALLEDVLDRSGYVHARVEGSTRMKIRRLVRRLNLNAHDAEVWLGMLRQILWKLVS